MKILIAGSRNFKRYDLVDTFIENYVGKFNTVIVGDNPKGVDYYIHNYYKDQPIKTTVYGLHKYPRSKIVNIVNYIDVSKILKVKNYSYDSWHKRDKFMIEQSDFGLFFWNGNSKGTLAGYEYMRSLGKACLLINENENDKNINSS